MILHHQLCHPKNGQLTPWLSVDCESLALFLNTPQGQRNIQESITPLEITAVIESHSIQCVGKSALTYAQAEVPEWLLLNSEDSTTPAIMHTSDPIFISLADPTSAVIKAPEYYRSGVDLSAEGWAYWWEDAQRAFEKLTVESASAFDISVPKEIQNLL